MSKKIRVHTDVHVDEWIPASVDVEIEDFEEDDLIEYLESQGYVINNSEIAKKNLSFKSKPQEAESFYKFLCDKCDVNHYTPIHELLEKVKNILEPATLVRPHI